MRNYQEDFKKVRLSRPHCILGKNFQNKSDEFIKHVEKLLKRYKIIKIKALKSIATKSNIKEFATKISEATESYLLDLRGKTFIISKYNIKKN